MLKVIILLTICCWTTIVQGQIFYKCDFEEQCEDFVFDDYWFVDNVSSHIDHTYKNLSGHYITYTNTSFSQPLTTYQTRGWVDPPADLTACLSQWFYSGPGGFDLDIELAQGDDLQARLPVGHFGVNLDDPQWRGFDVVLPFATHFVPFVIYNNITSLLDLDDLSVWSCSPGKPVPPITTILDCDFDKNLCSELVSLSNYSYTWSIIQAEEAQNYTTTAPPVDYSVGSGEGIFETNSMCYFE